MKRRLIRTLITGTVVGSLIVAPVYAAPQDDVEFLENQKSQAEAQAASVNQNLVDLLVEYEALQTDMENQEKEIDQAGKDLEKAEAKEKQQYEDMKLRIKYMYENGEESYLSVLVSATDFADFVNKAEYVQKVNKYDRDMLDEYVATKNEIKDLKVDLEAGQATMSDMARDMESQKSSLESTLTQMQSQIADFDTQLAAAREAAAAQLEELTSEADTSAADEVIETVAGNTENAGNSNSSGSKPSGNSSSKPSGGTSSKPSGDSSSSSSSKPSNASLGQQIANKGCEYIGYPYKYGGNSLTGGIDCSGFVYQIHKIFGITTPRQSSSLRYGGKGVSYADKLPGDVICYSNHVAIYIGNNMVVHASNSAPYPSGGIKTTTPANYKTVLAVRRYW